jgi:hypothetical protein
LREVGGRGDGLFEGHTGDDAMEELSENLRKGLLVEMPMKKERGMQKIA